MLAIVIPFYKLSYFKETLESLKNQTDNRFKVYIGDDASPENPTELLNYFKDEVNFIYKKFEDNLGGISLVKQWERCIDLIEEETWILLLGDDDTLESNVVESFYKYYPIFNTKSNLVRFSSCVINNDNQELVDSKIFKHPTWENPYQSYCRKIRGISRSSLSEHVFSKEIYQKNRFTEYPVAFFSDDKAWLDFSDEKSIYSINEACVYIGTSEKSISGKTDNLLEKIEAEIMFISEIYYNKLHNFDKACRLDFIRKFEVAILKKRKLNVFEWLSLYASYLKNYDKKLFIKLNKRFVKTLIYGEKVFY